MPTLIGDCHNQYELWKNVTKKHEKTIQLGDFGMFSKVTKTNAWKILEQETEVDPTKHKILGGNHEDYSICVNSPFYLGDFGTIDGIYYVRGAYSFNKSGLMPNVEWFEDEELKTSQQFRAFALYVSTKPDIVISHDCPTAILSLLKENMVIDKTDTRYMLQNMLEAHTPKLWVFGHHHISKSVEYNGCEFRCLNEMETYEI